MGEKESNVFDINRLCLSDFHTVGPGGCGRFAQVSGSVFPSCNAARLRRRESILQTRPAIA